MEVSKPVIGQVKRGCNCANDLNPDWSPGLRMTALVWGQQQGQSAVASTVPPGNFLACLSLPIHAFQCIPMTVP